MNRPGDQHDHSDDGADFEQLFADAIGDEPPMASMPADDLSRGRKLVRRRRTGALMTCAAAIPAVALVGWTLTSGGPSQGSGPSVISPADSSDDSTDECAVLTLDDLSSPPAPGLVEGNAGGKAIEKGKGGARVSGSNANLDETTGPGDPPDAPSVTCVVGTLTEVCSFDAGADPTGGATEDQSGDKSDETTGSESDAPATAVCPAEPGDASTPEDAALDRISAVLDDYVGAHAGGTGNSAMMGMASASGSSDDEGASEVGASTDWTGDADHAGGLGLSLAKDISAMDACQAASEFGGPNVTCDKQQAADGTDIVVGHGAASGADRLVVCLEKPSGAAACATSDAATGQWWEDQSGPSPMNAVPVDTSGLVELLGDPAIHF